MAVDMWLKELHEREFELSAWRIDRPISKEITPDRVGRTEAQLCPWRWREMNTGHPARRQSLGLQYVRCLLNHCVVLTNLILAVNLLQ